MSTLKANIGFTAEFEHDFYDVSDKHTVNKSLVIEPAASTAAVLKGARMLYRSTPKGFSVYYNTYTDPSTNTQVPFTTLPDTDMTFAMRLADKDKLSFLNYTQLYIGTPASITKAYTPDKLIYLKATSPGTMTYDLIDYLRPDLFTFNFQIATSTSVNVTMVHESGSPTITLNGLLPSNSVYSAQIDLRGKKTGKYTLTATPNAGATLTVVFYVDKELYGTDLFGIISVPFKATFYTTPGNYYYKFIARQVKWRYYAVVKGAVSGTINVIDTRSTPLVTFTTEQGSSPNTVKIDGKNALIYLSDQYIAFTESSLTVFKLRNISTSKDLIPVLPNPKLDGFDSDRYDQLIAQPTQKNISEMFVFLDTI